MSHALERTITVSSVIRFTMPSIIMMVVLSLYTVVDAMFVSRLVNRDAFLGLFFYCGLQHGNQRSGNRYGNWLQHSGSVWSGLFHFK